MLWMWHNICYLQKGSYKNTHIFFYIFEIINISILNHGKSNLGTYIQFIYTCILFVKDRSKSKICSLFPSCIKMTV